MFSNIDQYRELHASKIYGASSAKVASFLIPHLRLLRPHSLIDYGCGQSVLPEILKATGISTVYRYDPAIPAYAERPTRTFDVLISVDVLEHIPERDLEAVLADMRSFAPHAMLIIDIRPAAQILPNGQNAHAIVESPEWWRERLSRHYEYLEPFSSKPRERARFKTWPTPAIQKPLISAQTAVLRLRRHYARRLFGDR
jgi:hypothetical protein